MKNDEEKRIWNKIILFLLSYLNIISKITKFIPVKGKCKYHVIEAKGNYAMVRENLIKNNGRWHVQEKLPRYRRDFQRINQEFND